MLVLREPVWFQRFEQYTLLVFMRMPDCWWCWGLSRVGRMHIWVGSIYFDEKNSLLKCYIFLTNWESIKKVHKLLKQDLFAGFYIQTELKTPSMLFTSNCTQSSKLLYPKATLNTYHELQMLNSFPKKFLIMLSHIFDILLNQVSLRPWYWPLFVS